ncbi:DUF4412 domain-containing protein [Sinanaerobacter chloroacetimidivorans]|uniref:DUF4412 domain-containing protein n=1 Tax=Sinanaerobacter chloroacetimidivorans TaxID=2818044 RepID=A0A8J8B297_9FIRM|nr:DUF4412 domain-containing protein [Sinanaerobacter chloroacetimidivorans]MBR0599064.1 hypothetical protein [Sinanaerobacter chloroacetimidivorans]
MKKILSCIFVAIFVLVMVTGCGGGGEKAQPENGVSQQESDNQQAEESSKNVDTDSLGDKLASTYIAMMKDEKYLMKYKASLDMEGQQVEMEATVAVKGDDTAIISKGAGMESTMIFKDDTMYMVDHGAKSVLVMAQTDKVEDETINTEGITYVGSGKEGGLTYEEYSTEDGTLKYYFDGKKLVKITADIAGLTTTMEILEMSNQVPDSLFEIPAGYEKIAM